MHENKDKETITPSNRLGATTLERRQSGVQKLGKHTESSPRGRSNTLELVTELNTITASNRDRSKSIKDGHKKQLKRNPSFLHRLN